MEYVALTKWEWQIICAQGSGRILAARVCDIPEAQSDVRDVYRLFATAPQFNLGDAHALVVAELIPEWRSVSLPGESGLNGAIHWLSLQGVKSFSPLTDTAMETFHGKAADGAIILDPPKFERFWHDWVTQQTQDVMKRSAERFVRILGLAECLPDVSNVLDQHTDSDVCASDPPGSLVKAFLDHSRKITKNDQARSVEGTCAHGIVCATLWASFRCDRAIPADDGELRALLDRRLERYSELQYGDAGYLTTELHRELDVLAQEAPTAFNHLLTATSIGIYLRFSVAIQHGPAPKPKHLVEAILRLQALDGTVVAAMCAYLIGLKLKPQDVHQIAMATEGDKYPAVNMASAAERLGLGSLEALRQSLAAPMFDPDVALVAVDMPGEPFDVPHTDETESITDGLDDGQDSNGESAAPP